MRRIRAMSLGIELIINNGVSSSGRIPDITGEAGQVNSILAERFAKYKASWIVFVSEQGAFTKLAEASLQASAPLNSFGFLRI